MAPSLQRTWTTRPMLIVQIASDIQPLGENYAQNAQDETRTHLRSSNKLVVEDEFLYNFPCIKSGHLPDKQGNELVHKLSSTLTPLRLSTPSCVKYLLVVIQQINSWHM